MSNKRWSKSKSVEAEKKVPTYSTRVVHTTASETVCLVLQRDMTLNITGKVTGKVYHFAGAGCELNVDKQDAEKMLEDKKSYISCCGSTSSPYFQIK